MIQDNAGQDETLHCKAKTGEDKTRQNETSQAETRRLRRGGTRQGEARCGSLRKLRLSQNIIYPSNWLLA